VKVCVPGATTGPTGRPADGVVTMLCVGTVYGAATGAGNAVGNWADTWADQPAAAASAAIVKKLRYIKGPLSLSRRMSTRNRRLRIGWVSQNRLTGCGQSQVQRATSSTEFVPDSPLLSTRSRLQDRPSDRGEDQPASPIDRITTAQTRKNRKSTHVWSSISGRHSGLSGPRTFPKVCRIWPQVFDEDNDCFCSTSSIDSRGMHASWNNQSHCR